MRRYAITLLPLLLMSTCGAQQLLKLEECKADGKSPGFKNVTISPCEKDPCVIKTGEKYNVTFYAEATEDADFLMVSTLDQQHTDTTNIQSAHSISCHFIDIPCNVTKGEVFRGSVTLRILSAFTPGNVTYMLEVGNGKGSFACGVANLLVE
uniref:ML domain containing protein n=1 Tax=Rhipicephalus zambeziensis TaxID=60191 RepID=A0A224YNY7_9ACAR